jgi:hypothetical protein
MNRRLCYYSFWKAICCFLYWFIYVWKGSCALCGQSYLYAICALMLMLVPCQNRQHELQMTWYQHFMVPVWQQHCTWITHYKFAHGLYHYNKFWNFSKLTQNEQFLQHLHHNFLMVNATSSLM